MVGNYDHATGVVHSSSSLGPTRDGRLKPDIVAPGSNITSTTLFSTNYRNQDEPHTYESMLGTSMAAPHVAGIAALLHQVQRDRTPGCTTHHDVCSAYDGEALRNATVKATLIHTAQDLVYSESQAQQQAITPNLDLSEGEGTPTHTFYGTGPDYATGWGLVDASAARLVVTENRYREEYDLRQGEERRYTFNFPLAASWQRVTLAWDDAPAEAFTDSDASLSVEEARRLVNDLDMYLVDPLGRAWYPWQIPQLLSQTFPVPTNCTQGGIAASLSACDAITRAEVRNTQAFRVGPITPTADPIYFDHFNNVERVDVTNGPAGDWTVVVIGRRILGTQNFTLVHRGLELTPQEEIELVYRARTRDETAPLHRTVWREWRRGGDEHTAGTESSDAYITGLVLDTRGTAAGTLQLQGRIKYMASGLETDWQPWADEGERMLGDPSHPFQPITQVEFRTVFPHIGTTFYDVEYQVFESGTGWSPWVCGGTPLGTPGEPIRGLRMRLKSSSTAPVCQ